VVLDASKSAQHALHRRGGVRVTYLECCAAHSTSELGHFETKSDACHCASIGLILLQELTFWRSAKQFAPEARAPFPRRAHHRRSARCHHLEHVADLQAPAADEERRQAKRNSLADKIRIERAAVEGERRTVEADLGPVRYLATLLGAADEVVLRWFILVVALLLDPAAVLLLLAATRTRS
jgi:hypothetical protein